MKEAQFIIARDGVPRYWACFRVRKVPFGMESRLAVGDLMYWNIYRWQMVKVSSSMCLTVEAEHLDFVAYMTHDEMEVANVANA